MELMFKYVCINIDSAALVKAISIFFCCLIIVFIAVLASINIDSATLIKAISVFICCLIIVYRCFSCFYAFDVIMNII